MSQPSDKPTRKRAADLLGEHIKYDSRLGPIEVTHVQPYRTPHGEARVLVVTVDGAASNHEPDEMFMLGTAEEIVVAERRRERDAVIADIRALADWYEQHPDVPAPLAVDARIHLDKPNLSDAEKRRAIEAVAAAMGVEVKQSGRTLSARYAIADFNPARVEVGVSVWLDDEQEPSPLDVLPGGADNEHQEDSHGTFTVLLPEPGEQKPAHYEAGGWKGGGDKGGCGVECACGVTYDGFDSLAEAAALLTKHIEEGNAAAAAMRETPLDELPDDFGADHDPTDSMIRPEVSA